MTPLLHSFRDRDGLPVTLQGACGAPAIGTTPTSTSMRRSGRSLVVRAAKGDGDARLDGWSIEEVEKSLKDVKLNFNNACLLEWLQRPDANSADSVREALEDMAHQAEEHAVYMALVWRYAKEYEVWKYCSNPDWRTEESFLNSLHGSQTVRICVQFGTSTDAARRSKIQIIHQNWGGAWYYDACERNLLPRAERGPVALSKGLLTEIAKMSRVVDLDRAMELWEQVINERASIAPGRSTGWRNSLSPHLTPADFTRLAVLCLETPAPADNSVRMKRRHEEIDDEILELRSSTGWSSSSLFRKPPPETSSKPRRDKTRNSGRAKEKEDSGATGHGTQTEETEEEHDSVCVSANKRRRKPVASSTADGEGAQGTSAIKNVDNSTSRPVATSALAAHVLRPPSATDVDSADNATDTTLLSDNAIKTSSLICSLEDRYGPTIRKLLATSCQANSNTDTAQQHEVRRHWLTERQWASIYVDDEKALGTGSASAEHAEVWYLTWAGFHGLSKRGHVFDRPVVIKQHFQDSGMYSVDGFVDLLERSFPDGTIDVQDWRTGACVAMNVSKYCDTVRHLDSVSVDQASSVSNAINLGRIAEADQPLFTRLPRFRLLSTLSNRLKKIPGKTVQNRVADVESCLGFDLLGFPGAFSGPHVDALVGTWVRCLAGAKLWMIAAGMDDEDWRRFAEEGSNWLPREKGRMIVLEQDDVLLMPPGALVVHSVFTLEPCLMEGGMLWDECNIPAILDGLLWVIRNQSCTNEAVAYQLPQIIEALEEWLQDNEARVLPNLDELKQFRREVRPQIQALWDTGCSCGSGCDSDNGCKCAQEYRRCTSWCSSHPSLPPKVDQDRNAGSSAKSANRVFSCMYEEK